MWRYPPPNWRVAALTTGDVVLMKLLLAGWALWRAADYASAVNLESIGAIEDAAPMWMWVGMCWISSTLIFLGVAACRHHYIFAGHLVGMIVYPALTVGAAINAFRDWPPLREHIYPVLPTHVFCLLAALTFVLPVIVTAWQGRLRRSWRRLAAVAFFSGTAAFAAMIPADGLRTVGPLFMLSMLHFLFALRSGRTPICEEDGHTTVEERVISEDTVS